MIKRYNTLSFAYFIPGMILQFASVTVDGGVSVALGILGTILAIVGFGYYAKAKGRSSAWGIVGLLGILGLIVLACLKDRSGDPWNA